MRSFTSWMAFWALAGALATSLDEAQNHSEDDKRPGGSDEPPRTATDSELALVMPMPSSMLAESMDSFFVCSSPVKNMNGKYVRHKLFEQHPGDPPVYVKDDDDGIQDVDDDEDPSSPSHQTQDEASGKPEENDFRLFRHGMFWMFADFASWPPTTHFRCDPTRAVSYAHPPQHPQHPHQQPDSGSPRASDWHADIEINFEDLCGYNRERPPIAGYSPVLDATSSFSGLANGMLVLHPHGCDQLPTIPLRSIEESHERDEL